MKKAPSAPGAQAPLSPLEQIANNKITELQAKVKK